ncbi:phosphatase PhoE [Paenibacillus sp. JCM 10914]|uniref:histidine phosphatase family protein n=1 Tax=Paenibacillus sp. JCM 10914 TaxID=1236974 RepID=UPI0003CC6AC7|nr:histidine phosphatase family protein [Paenibacillus sp. JCM 10914]GAE06909.1 phosphoglycerate mutase [Paenibacillus sp. JCM 10914]
MPIIGLVRHGITDWNAQNRAQGRTDIPLNAEGRRQAHWLAQRLMNEHWDTIVTSPLIRARETAEILARGIQMQNIIKCTSISEMDCGLIEGTTEDERLARWGADWRQQDLGMEHFELIAARGTQFLEEVWRSYSGQRVLVVSHGAIIGLSLQKLLPERFATTYINNASLTLLTKVSGTWDCTLYNDTNHLTYSDHVQ